MSQFQSIEEWAESISDEEANRLRAEFAAEDLQLAESDMQDYLALLEREDNA